MFNKHFSDWTGSPSDLEKVTFDSKWVGEPDYSSIGPWSYQNYKKFYPSLVAVVTSLSSWHHS